MKAVGNTPAAFCLSLIRWMKFAILQRFFHLKGKLCHFMMIYISIFVAQFDQSDDYKHIPWIEETF